MILRGSCWRLRTGQRAMSDRSDVTSEATADWCDRVTAVVDQAHVENWGGEHREGFCKACANAYIVAQHAVPKDGREEWHVESIGGGITGTRAEADAWIAEWRNEYGDRYEIHVRRRVVIETPWEDHPCP